MLDQTSPQPSDHEVTSVLDPNRDGEHSESIVNVMWRFKWLLFIFWAVGTGIGYWIYKQKPTSYRATTQLMFKSDAPLMLDASTGVVRGGIPSGELMQTLITSDAIVKGVASHPELKSVPSLQGRSEKEVMHLIRQGISLDSITDLKDSRDRMVTALHFSSGDPQLCVAAVSAVSQSIGDHFENERESMIAEFGKLIDAAKSKFVDKQEILEEEYKTFRENARLEYDSQGHAINPHRERQFLLQSHRIDIEQKQRELASELRFAESTNQRNDDPLMTARIIGQLSGVVDEFEGVSSISGVDRDKTKDLALQQYEVGKSLIPLEIQREQLELAYGASHPEVKAIAMQIQRSEEKLNELNAQVAKRQQEINAENKLAETDPQIHEARVSRARVAVEAYIQGLKERLFAMEGDLSELDVQINEEKTKADELKKAEDKNASYTRRIESIKSLGAQLEQQLAALNLADVNNGGITVEPLLVTEEAYVTGPDLKKDLILYGMLGLGLSGLIAMLIEAGAMTFRSAEEVQRELRLPVLTHIPLDEGRIQKGKGMVDDQIALLDPKLSVVHRPYSPAAEAVRGIRAAMMFDQRQFKSQVFQVTSPLPGDGKSTLAANVGCSVAQSGKRTLLIDLDLRSPRLTLRFNVESKTGLTNVLNGELAPVEAVHQTPIENLDILPCGPLPANPAEALTLAELGDVFQWARANYDIVIVDTPPLLMVSDPVVVTTYIDAAMLVMRIRRRCKPNTKEAVSMLRSSGARVMGVVVNKVDEVSGGASYKTSASGSYQSIGYGYGDKYRRRYQQEANAQDTYVVKGKHASGPTGIYTESRTDAEPESLDHEMVPPRGPALAAPAIQQRQRKNVRS